MYKFIRLGLIPVALALSACDVQVNDTTPAEYQANNDIGMYKVSATASPGSLVTPGSLVMFAIGEDNKKVELRQYSDGSWQGLYSTRCHNSFPLQILAVWRLQGLSTREALVPPQPRQIKLTEPPLSKQEGFDTAKPAEGKTAKGAKGKPEWEGVVDYRFVTMPVTQIQAAHIEPSSSSAEDVAAARAISVKTPMPLQAPCAEDAKITLVSTEQRAHGTLDIETDNPGMPRWQTYVEFSPK
ncbi:MAG TPA: hypothetical protein VGR80_04045 [Steroidobacteraceae bacterium]|nr:hypothetical protein [Gammaproteobacteria bacterium]HEV2285192.1 hypothetical protein [Steroidobacteraceae bacterium]